MIPNSDYIIYKLVDPRDHVPFYVGYTSDLGRRFSQHLTDDNNEAKKAKIAELAQLGLGPLVEELERISGPISKALEREAYWIKHLLSQGKPLTNTITAAPKRKQQTAWIPPDLARWLRVQAVMEDRELSEIITDALERYRLDSE